MLFQRFFKVGLGFTAKAKVGSKRVSVELSEGEYFKNEEGKRMDGGRE